MAVALGVAGAATGAGGDQTIGTIAGTGTAGIAGDGGPATSAQLNEPIGVAVDAQGNVYIADHANNAIREVSNGKLTTIAGDGFPGKGVDGVPATQSQLDHPYGVAVDTNGDVYIADFGGARI